VVRSLEAALWASNESVSFEEGYLLAVNLGDRRGHDGRHLRAACRGLLYGEEEIPERWLSKLAHRGVVEDFAENSSTGVPVQGSPKLVTFLP
jgi:ADP-ribosyl-[dinitrogen reductase] hydrolase